MYLKLLALAIIGLSLAADPLYETSGFHCKSKLSMKLDRTLHGEPRDAPPPFDVQVLDEEGHKTEYYEPGKIYTIRLIGYQYYRGLLLQPRLCDEHGFIIGSLRGGRFLETPDWIQYGIRLQECDMKYPLEDSVTHADDSRKFVTQIQWTTERDIGNVQFMFTIVSENDVYWERWRPQSAFLKPVYSKQFPSEVLRQVFYNEKYALKFLAGKFTSSQESKMASSQEVVDMPKLEEILIATEKPEMPMEAKKVLEKMEMPEFWSHHDGEVKIDNAKKDDILETKEEGESEFISDNKNSGEAKVNEEMIEEITESDEERVEEKPFIGDAIMEDGNETTTNIPDHESITHLPDDNSVKSKTIKASLDSGEATVQPSEPETLKDEKPLKPAFEEAFSHDEIEVKEVEATIPPTESTLETITEQIETTTGESENRVEEVTTENLATSVAEETEATTSVPDEIIAAEETKNPMIQSDVTLAESTPETLTQESLISTTQSEETQPDKEETTSLADAKVMDETTNATAEKVVEEIEDVETTTESSSSDNETTPAENADEETTTEMPENVEETTEVTSTEAPTPEEEMKEIENDLSHISETPEAVTESNVDETLSTEPVETETENSNDLEIEATTQESENDETTENIEATEESTTAESEIETTMNDNEITREAEETTTEMPIEETTENSHLITETMEEIVNTESTNMETDTDAKNEETTEAPISETTENLNTDEFTTSTIEENEATTKIENTSENEETTKGVQIDTTTVAITEEAVTEIIATESTEETITSTAAQEALNDVENITGTTPTFDDLITTLPSLEETASSILDVEPTTEAPAHPKDVSRRRR